MKIIILYLEIIYFNFQLCATKSCPKPPINCLLCRESCPKNEVLIKSLCGCCYNKCIPKPFICPQEEIACKRCIETCPENQTLVKSPCGCCYDQCVPNTVCPKPPIECLLCHWSCPENQTLEVSPCGCCYNRCVPKKTVCPDPPINCLICHESCPENQTLEVSPCGCCYNKCVPKKTVCPDPPINCLICHESCPENQTLEVSPCGCCHNRCVPNQEPSTNTTEPDCPADICQRVKCASPTCENGSILVEKAGFCGCCAGCVTPKIGDKCYTEVNTGLQTCGNKLRCCNGRCERKTFYKCLDQEPPNPTKPVCPPNACQTVRCGLPKCENGTILVEGAGYCGCCPGCVTPKIGDKCYTDFNTGLQTCGNNLICCNGTCRPYIFTFFNYCSVNPCGRVNCPYLPAKCPREGEIILRQEGQCCPGCVKPRPGDRCYIDPLDPNNTTCGPDLLCCRDGICASK